jgi:tetratricopeptide (TPR) repeat protein
MGFWRKQVIQPALDSDIDSAIREQMALLEQDPFNARAYFALGTLAHFQRRTEAAIGCFLKAIELDPNDPAPHVSLGRIYAIEGHDDLAWKHAREAERLGDRSLLEQLERYPNATAESGKR